MGRGGAERVGPEELPVGLKSGPTGAEEVFTCECPAAGKRGLEGPLCTGGALEAAVVDGVEYRGIIGPICPIGGIGPIGPIGGIPIGGIGPIGPIGGMPGMGIPIGGMGGIGIPPGIIGIPGGIPGGMPGRGGPGGPGSSIRAFLATGSIPSAPSAADFCFSCSLRSSSGIPSIP